MSNKVKKIQKNIEAKEFLHYPDAYLRVPSQPVTEFDTDRLYETIRKMRLSNSREKGLGVAAIQIGINDRMFYYRVPEIGEGVMINPEINFTSANLVPMKEGCLSIRGYYWEVHRPEGIVVSWQDQHGEEHQTQLDGLMSRLVQHELDHLDGTMLVDHLSDEDYDKFEDMYFNQGKRTDFGPMIITGE